MTTQDPDDPDQTRLLAIDAAGRVVQKSEWLPLGGTSAWTGAGPDGRPIAPLVATDGIVYVVGEAEGSAVVYAIDPPRID